MTNLPFTGKFKITKFYGEKDSRYKAGYHTGIDLVGLTNSYVYSVCDGIVKKINNLDNNAYGKYIKIEDSMSGKIFLFAHLDRIRVKKGQKVNRASIIGIMGKTGNSRGKHTHIELRSDEDVYGKDEDPGIYMGLTNCEKNVEYNSSDFQIKEDKNLVYNSHCQNLGWQGERKNGEMSGLYGQGLRIEAIIINADINIQYRVHMSEIGWGNWVSNGYMAGTIGESRAIEAIEIQSSIWNLIGQGYVENLGYLPKVEGTNITIGTTGKKLRLEGFKIQFQ